MIKQTLGSPTPGCPEFRMGAALPVPAGSKALGAACQERALRALPPQLRLLSLDLSSRAMSRKEVMQEPKIPAAAGTGLSGVGARLRLVVPGGA